MKKIFLFSTLTIISFLLFSSCTVYEVRHVRKAPEYYTLRIYDNRYVYYDGPEAVAVWTFRDDGVCVKEGVVISGPVRVYYQPDVLFAETYYVNSVRDGECRYYYPGGGVMYTGHYRGGYLWGGWASYREDGGISASFEFHGNETRMPDNFAPPAEPSVRAGFNSMQIENSYAGKRAVTRQFNKNSVPKNHGNSFGEMPSGHVKNVNAAVPAAQNNAAAYHGNANTQPVNNTAGAVQGHASTQPAANAAVTQGQSPNGTVNGNAGNGAQARAADAGTAPAVLKGQKHGNKQAKLNIKPVKNGNGGVKHEKKPHPDKTKVKPVKIKKDVLDKSGDKKPAL